VFYSSRVFQNGIDCLSRGSNERVVVVSVRTFFFMCDSVVDAGN